MHWISEACTLKQHLKQNHSCQVEKEFFWTSCIHKMFHFHGSHVWRTIRLFRSTWKCPFHFCDSNSMGGLLYMSNLSLSLSASIYLFVCLYIIECCWSDPNLAVTEHDTEIDVVELRTQTTWTQAVLMMMVVILVNKSLLHLHFKDMI